MESGARSDPGGRDRDGLDTFTNNLLTRIGQNERARGKDKAIDRRILVVDDDTETRDLLGERLADEGSAVVGATNVAEALLRLHREDVAAILLDKSMPGLSGLDMLPGLRTICPETPMVFITASGDGRTQPDARKGGLRIRVEAASPGGGGPGARRGPGLAAHGLRSGRRPRRRPMAPSVGPGRISRCGGGAAARLRPGASPRRPHFPGQARATRRDT
jgi:CheY-like chemotaxis protein